MRQPRSRSQRSVPQPLQPPSVTTLILLACVAASLLAAGSLALLGRAAPAPAQQEALRSVEAAAATLPVPAPALRAVGAAAAALPAPAALSSSGACASAPPLRGALDPTALSALAFVNDKHHGRRVRFRHAVPFARCPKFIRPNYEAGLEGEDLTARFIPWVQALWVSQAMQAPNLAFAHASPAGEPPATPAFPDLDAFFGLRAGESSKTAAQYKEAMHWEFGCPPGLQQQPGGCSPHALEPLASAPTARLVPGAALLEQWGARTGDLSNDCNVIYRPAAQQLAAEAPSSLALRHACAHKFASAARERAAMEGALLAPPVDADPAAAHVCIDLGSSGSSRDAQLLAHALRAHVLPRLTAPLARVVLHVFGGSTPDAAAALLALGSSAGAAATAVHAYAAGTPQRDVAWHAARADFFLAGPGSALGWPLALFAWRPLVLLAGGGGSSSWGGAPLPLPQDAVELGSAGEPMGPRGEALVAAAAARLVAQAGCGLLTEASWVDPVLPQLAANAEERGYNS